MVAFNCRASDLNEVSNILRSENSSRHRPSSVAQANIVPRGLSIRHRSMTLFSLLFLGEIPKTDLNESVKLLRDSNPELNAASVILSPPLIFLKAVLMRYIRW